MAVSTQQILLCSLYREGGRGHLASAKRPFSQQSLEWILWWGLLTFHQNSISPDKKKRGQAKVTIQTRSLHTLLHLARPDHCLCVNDPWTKNGFYISKWLKKKKKIFMPCNLYEIRISVSMNKVLLGYSHAHHLHIDYGCFQDTRAESDTCSAEQTAHKAENISCLALTENICLMTPDQDFLSQPPLRGAGGGAHAKFSPVELD